MHHIVARLDNLSRSIFVVIFSRGRVISFSRFTLIRPTLEDGVSQVQVARTHDISKSTIGRWVKRYREIGLAGLVDAPVRSDKGKSRRLPAEAVTLIEGLALQNPPRTIAAIHRQVCAIPRIRHGIFP